MLTECLSLILIAQNALVPVQIDEIVKTRISEKLTTEFKEKIKPHESENKCNLSLEYYYTPEKVVFIGENFILKGKKEVLIDDILEGRIPSFKTLDTPPISQQFFEKPEQQKKKSRLKKALPWILGAAGAVAAGVLATHLYSNREKPSATGAAPSQPKQDGPTPINF